MHAYFLHFRVRTIAGCLALLLTLLPFSACLAPTLPPVVKIGLVAPFEGVARDVGYDVVYAARLAIREINGADGINGYRLELVSYDDRGDPELAVTAARNLAADGNIIAVIGHFQPATTEAALTIYAAADLPLLALGANDETYPTPETLPGSAAWIDAYRAVGPHTPPPGMHALPTYEAVQTIAQTIAAVSSTGVPTRMSIAAALPNVEHNGLLGNVQWRPEATGNTSLIFRMLYP